MTTQQPDALRLAAMLTADEWPGSVTLVSYARECVAELLRQHARIAELESELEAVGAGGVQALSAAPGVTSEQRRLIGVIADKIEDGTLFQSGIYPKKDLARFVRNMLDATPTAPAASPTPTAEQPIGEVVVTKDEDGQIVAVTRQDDEGRILSVIATSDPRNSRAWPKVSGVSRDEGHSRALLVFFAAEPTDDEMRAVHDTLAASPTPPAEQQAAPKAAPGGLSADSLRHQNKLLAETLGACILASGIVRKDIDGFTGPELLHFGEDLRSMLEAAPQQGVQGLAARYTIEDVRKARSEGYRNGVESSVPSKITKEMRHAFREKYKEGSIWTDRLDIALEGMLAVAPQPAPAPLSECLRLLNSFEYEGDEDSQAKAFFKAHINEDWFFHVKNSLELALAAQGGQ